MTYQGSFQAANLYATILFVVVEAVLLTQALNWVERRACARFGQAVVA